MRRLLGCLVLISLIAGCASLGVHRGKYVECRALPDFNEVWSCFEKKIGNIQTPYTTELVAYARKLSVDVQEGLISESRARSALDTAYSRMLAEEQGNLDRAMVAGIAAGAAAGAAAGMQSRQPQIIYPKPSNTYDCHSYGGGNFSCTQR